MASSKEEIKKKKEKDIKLEKVKNPEKNAKAKSKRKIIIAITLVVIIILVMFLSVIFAFIQNGRNTIVKGVSAKKVELSNLTVSDAKQEIMKEINKELKTPLKLIYGEYSLDVNISEIEFSYNVDEMLQEAYSIGRAENIIQSNYEILSTMTNGKEIEIKYSVNENALNNLISNVDTGIPGKATKPTYDIEDKELIITPGKDGIELKKDELKKLIIDSIKNRDASIENKEYQEITIPIENKSAEAIDIEKIYSEVHCEPQDAYLIKEPFQLVKDVSGIDFAVSMEEAKALITGDKEEYIIPLKITPASKTVADLGDEAFPHTIATYTTSYDAGYTARSTNLRLASNKINGTVLLPGEEFSFNKVVGKRTVQDGYQNAPIYENGKVVDGLAGGICQISSTLYNAVLLANLDIVERRNHNFTSTYVPAGRDATVVYGAIDFKFKNSRQYPIKIVSSVSGGIAKFEIKGIKEDTEYEVKIYTKTTEETPFREEVEEDSSIPAGTKRVVQGGHNGLKVSSYRALVLNGKEVSRELLANDTYRVMNRIVKVPATKTEEPVTDAPSTVVEDLPTTTQPVPEKPIVQETPTVPEVPETPSSTESSSTPQTPTEPNNTPSDNTSEILQTPEVPQTPQEPQAPVEQPVQTPETTEPEKENTQTAESDNTGIQQ